MIRAWFVLGLLLAGCLADAPDEDPPAPPAPPDTRTAQRADPRCQPGGRWNDSLAACEYPDERPPAPRP